MAKLVVGCGTPRLYGWKDWYSKLLKVGRDKRRLGLTFPLGG
jgi:hypothetical protein